jgi:diguanylate cyclase (GGDEF)-like protein
LQNSGASKNPWHLSILLVAESPGGESRTRACLAGDRRGGFRIEAFTLLDQAVEALRTRPYDLLLVDLALPEERSLNTLLRARMLAPRLPIVLMTAHADEELGVQALEAGVQDYLIHGGEPPADLGRRLRQTVVRYWLALASRRGGPGSLIDPVTGLVDGDAFLRRCGETLTLAQRLGEHPALLLLEVDDGTALEARLGRWGKSRMLQEIGRRFGWCVRRADVLGRLGPERFGVLLSHASKNPAILVVAERLRKAASAPFEIRGTCQRLSVSIGAAWHPQDGTTREELLRHAEAAMLEARRLGGNRWRQAPSFEVPPELGVAGDLLGDLPDPLPSLPWS